MGQPRYPLLGICSVPINFLGMALGADPIEFEKRVKKEVSDRIDSEEAFFEFLGVDRSIIYYGIENLDEIEISARANNESYIGWDFSIEDMSKFNIVNVTVKSGIWEPKLPNGEKVYRFLL